MGSRKDTKRTKRTLKETKKIVKKRPPILAKTVKFSSLSEFQIELDPLFDVDVVAAAMVL